MECLVGGFKHDFLCSTNHIWDVILPINWLIFGQDSGYCTTKPDANFVDFTTGWWFGTWLLFSPIAGMMIQYDFHIFQRDWNHQLDKFVFTEIVCGLNTSSEHPHSQCISLTGDYTIHLLCMSSIQQSSPTVRLLATEPFSSAHFKQSLRTMYQAFPSHLVLLVIYRPISQSIFTPFANHLLRLTHHSAVATRNATFSTARRFETHVHHRASARDLVILAGAFSKKISGMGR